MILNKVLKTVKSYQNLEMAARLLAIGIVPGSQIKILRKISFGGGYYIRFNNQHFAFRTQELAQIIFE